MKLAITGATGYIGEALTACALAHGHSVIALSRRKPTNIDIPWMRFDLSDSIPLELPKNVDVIVHLAATTQSPSFDEISEIRSAQRVIDASAAHYIPIIFVSSQSARPNAPTSYGRAKWEIEQIALAAGGIAIRPGQVYGGPNRGLFGELVDLVDRHFVLPAFWPAPRIQPVHVDDLAEAIIRVASSHPANPAVLNIGADTPISFSAFLKGVARFRTGKMRLFVPVPTAVVRTAAWLAERTGFAGTSLARLISLFELTPMTTVHDLDHLELRLRPLAQGLLPTGNARRRALIGEGLSLLAYVLRQPASSALVRRYVRAVELLRTPEPLNLPRWALKHPAAVALFERAASKSPEFKWRLEAAVVLAEATPLGAVRFLRAPPARTGPIRTVIVVLLAVLREVAWRAAGLICGPLWRRRATYQ